MNEVKEDEIEIDLLKLFHIIWGKAYWIVLAAVLTGGLFFCYSACYIKPVYQSDAYIYVHNSPVSSVDEKISILPGELDAAQSLVDVYAFITKSRSALNEVVERTGADYTYEELNSMVSASSVNGMEILKVSVQSTDPLEAELIANTIADVLPEAISRVVEGSSVRVIDYAVVPEDKISPNIPKNTVLGMLLGAFLCGGILVVWAILDDTITGKDYLLQNYQLPVLASIPNLHLQIYPVHHQKQQEKEAYHQSGGEHHE